MTNNEMTNDGIDILRRQKSRKRNSPSNMRKMMEKRERPASWNFRGTKFKGTAGGVLEFLNTYEMYFDNSCVAIEFK